MVVSEYCSVCVAGGVVIWVTKVSWYIGLFSPTFFSGSGSSW